jgi:hypothetical protein
MRRLRLLLLALALGLALALAATGAAYLDGTAVPTAQGPPALAPADPAAGRVVLRPAALGAYGSFGERGAPAWELRRDPELVQQYGAGNDSVLLLRCDCGKVIRMLDHRVDAEGLVSPSIWHDVPGCGWHVMGRLEGWDHGEWSVTPQAAARGESKAQP